MILEHTTLTSNRIAGQGFKPVILLKAMLMGFSIDTGGYRWAIDNNRIGIIGTKDDEEIFLGVELTVNDFIRMASDLSDKEIALLAMRMALKQMAQARESTPRTLST